MNLPLAFFLRFPNLQILCCWAPHGLAVLASIRGAEEEKRVEGSGEMGNSLGCDACTDENRERGETQSGYIHFLILWCTVHVGVRVCLFVCV